MRRIDKLAFLFLIPFFLLGGCASNGLPAPTEHETERDAEENSSITNAQWTHEANHVEISASDGQEAIFYTVPMYFQQQFANCEFGAFNVAKEGGLVTCLSMLDSFYKSSFNTPDIFIEKYKDVFLEDGSYEAIDLMLAVAEDNGRKLYRFPFSAETLAELVGINRYAVLVHINHPSIYGNSSSYILVTGITENGNLYVRDPNRTNINAYATTEKNGETIYNSFDLIFSAGKNATIYVFGGGLGTENEVRR